MVGQWNRLSKKIQSDGINSIALEHTCAFNCKHTIRTLLHLWGHSSQSYYRPKAHTLIQLKQNGGILSQLTTNTRIHNLAIFSHKCKLRLGSVSYVWYLFVLYMYLYLLSFVSECLFLSLHNGYNTSNPQTLLPHIRFCSKMNSHVNHCSLANALSCDLTASQTGSAHTVQLWLWPLRLCILHVNH